MANALKKINARVKVLQKKHPKSKRSTLQKQAGREWKAGKLKGAVGAVRKRKAPKKKAAVRKRTRRAAAKPKVITKTRTIVRVVKAKRRRYKAKATKVRAYRATRYKRISGIGKMSSLVPLAGIAILGILAYKMLNKPAIPALSYTTNPIRASAQNNILQYAATVGLVGSALAALINAINKSDDNKVIAASQTQNPVDAFLLSQGQD